MKPLGVLFLAGCLMWATATTSSAVSVCTGTVDFDGKDACLDNVFNRTNVAGLDAKPSGDNYFLWFGEDVVVVRCIRPGETHTVLFAYHRQNNRACPLLNRVKDALEKTP